MKKLILLLALAAGLVAVPAFATDKVTTLVADGVVGTEDADTWVKVLIFTCNSELDAVAATSTRNGRPCYGVLRNGDDATWGGDEGDRPLLHFQSTMTEPTLVINYRDLYSQGKPGVFFDYGVYYDEVTGSTSITIGYEQ